MQSSCTGALHEPCTLTKRWYAHVLAAGANLEATDQFGSTALHVAAACEQADAAGLLVLLGANSSGKDGPLLDGDTPWQVADRFGFANVCAVLKANERKRLKLAGGNTKLVRHDSIFLSLVIPAPFSPKRMSVNGKW